MAIVQPEDDLQPSHAVAASIAADGFPPLTLVGGVSYLLFGPWVIVRYQAVPAVSVGYVSVGIGVTLLVVRWLLRTRSSGWVRRHHLSIMVVAAAPASTLPLLSMIAGREAYPATGMVIVLVLLGAAVQRPTWFASMLIVLAASWISIAAWLGIAVTWIRFGVELAMAVVASVGLHLAVRRTVRKLEEARRDLERLANTDELTGVASERRTFDEGNRRLAGSPRTTRASSRSTSTWTGSRRTTTGRATRPGTRSCGGSRRCCATGCGRATSSDVSVETSS